MKNLQKIEAQKHEHIAVTRAGEIQKNGHLKCTVVICTRNRAQHLQRCLEAVNRADYPYFDVLVVNNAPSDKLAEEVALRSGANYILEPVAGLSRARNRGARTTNADIVVFLDDDAVPGPEWLGNLVSEFYDPLVMAVVGGRRPLKVETETEHLCARLERKGAHALSRRVVDCQTPAWFELANFGGLGDGGNMAFRRKIFELWRGFDERLGRGVSLHGSERALCLFLFNQAGTPCGLHARLNCASSLSANRRRNASQTSKGHRSIYCISDLLIL